MMLQRDSMVHYPDSGNNPSVRPWSTLCLTTNCWAQSVIWKRGCSYTFVSDMNAIMAAFFWLAFAPYMFSYPFTFNLPVFL